MRRVADPWVLQSSHEALVAVALRLPVELARFHQLRRDHAAIRIKDFLLRGRGENAIPTFWQGTQLRLLRASQEMIEAWEHRAYEAQDYINESYDP